MQSAEDRRHDPGADLAIREDHPLGEVLEPEGTYLPLRVDPAAIANVKHNIRMVEEAFRDVLKPGLDYGTTFGVPKPFLFDSGASKCRDFFDVYPTHTIISHTVTDGLITIIVDVFLIDRKSGRIVASGVGASSMMESKYKWRWVDNPEDFGYKAEDCRQKVKGDKTVYRILNPDVDDLLNTILKMAAKRGEVDASQTLPGVATAMAKLKNEWGGGGKSGGDGKPKEENEWSRFWGAVKQMGLTQDQAHKILEVKSMKDWLDQDRDRTLEDAITTIRDYLIAQSGSPLADKKASRKKTAAPAGEEPEDFLAKHEVPLEEIRRILKSVRVSEMDPQFTGFLASQYGGVKVIEELNDSQRGDLLTVLRKRLEKEAPPPEERTNSELESEETQEELPF